MKEMSDVTRELENLEQWELNALQTPISSADQVALSQLRKNVSDAQRLAAENSAARQTEEQIFQSVLQSFLAWSRGELEKAATEFRQGDVLQAEVREATFTQSQPVTVQTSGGTYRSVCGLELAVKKAEDMFQSIHVLQILFCRQFTTRIVHNSSPALPVQDQYFGILPLYSHELVNARNAPSRYYLTVPRGVMAIPSPPAPGSSPHLRRVIGAPATPQTIQLCAFPASQWPDFQGSARLALQEAIGTFIGVLTRGTAPTFPLRR